jgi:hypothetical protein
MAASSPLPVNLIWATELVINLQNSLLPCLRMSKFCRASNADAVNRPPAWHTFPVALPAAMLQSALRPI